MGHANADVVFPTEGLLPKQATNADAFLARFPEYDGRDVRVAVLDTGVDPAALGLDGPNKVVDVIDCTGGGDVPLDTVEARKSADGASVELVSPTTKRTLLVSPAWENPTGVWKVGTKRAYDLWPAELVKRRTAERKSAFDVSQAALLQDAQRALAAFERGGPRGEPRGSAAAPESAASDPAPANGDEAAAHERALQKEELVKRIQLLKDLAKDWKDAGPIVEAVVFHDGTHWRAAVGGGEGDVSAPALGEPESVRAATLDLREKPQLTDFRTERQWACFGPMDLLTYTVNILDDGALLSLVTLSGTHGTHVAGIIGARTSDPATDGVAPASEIVSLKIGDARLGSMEQGQALLRAAQALVDTRCDVANMSYGEDGAFGVEDKGAFAEALRHVIREHHVCFVSSAGNNGPALTTVGQPGGTTSGVLSVGAYVNAGAMQQAEYALVEDGVPSSVTTWCSRGPSANGAEGVSIYAPGAAITSICRYALQSKQLMNGTSMSSPNAAGAVALLVCGLKARGIPATPPRIFRAIQATGADVADPQGVRFLDVNRAWDYLVEHRDDAYADAFFDVAVTPAGKAPGNAGTDRRGVYLRGRAETSRTNQFTVSAVPRFPHGETERSFALEIRAALSSDAPWVKVPEFLVLGGNGRMFEIRVAAEALPPGMHVARVSVYDTARPGTVLFDVPITVTKPVSPGPTYAFPRVRLTAGDIQREFVHVPEGATSAEVRVQSRAHEAAGTSARFWLHMLQLEPQQRLSRVENAFVMALNENEPVVKRIDVRGGQTLEVCAAQFWSSRAGFDLELDVEFHGVGLAAERTAGDGVSLVGGEGISRVVARSDVRVEELKPSITLDQRRRFVRPSAGDIRPLPSPRDRQPSGYQLSELLLSYPLSVTEPNSALTCALPISGNLYDAGVTLLTQLLDKSHAQVHVGDVYAKEVTLPRGEYTLRAQVLHTSNAVLERLRHMTLHVDQKLSKPSTVSLELYDDHVDLFSAAEQGTAPAAMKLFPGESKVLCVNTNLEGDALPAGLAPGDLLLGSMSLGGAAKAPVQFVVGPSPRQMDDDAGAGDGPQLPELLTGVARKISGEEQATFLAKLLAEYPDNLAVLTAQLEAAKPEAVADVDRTLAAADAVQNTIDEDALLHALGAKQPPAAEQTAEEKRAAKKRQAQKKALQLALTRRARALQLRGDDAAFAATLQHARKFLDDTGIDSSVQIAFTNLLVDWHTQQKRYVYTHGFLLRLSYAQALTLLRTQIRELGNGTAESLAELQRARDQELNLLNVLGWDIWSHWAQRWLWVTRRGAPEPF
ncbi:tripeptidyl-peptidase II [Malassezia sp. CBS 17886]|nr:tripeptidyl-peptidase II [Malassezia sp. CBS 17886]